jgi:hypothetical protein
MRSIDKQQAGTEVSVEELVRAIRAEQEKLAEQQSASVAGVVAIGRHLIALRELVQKGWARHLKSIGMNPRVASRYMAIARGSVGQVGHPVSDLAARLPYDVIRLEWLTKLPPDALARLAGEMDLRAATRAEVIKRVKEELGMPVTAPAIDHEQRLVKAFVQVCAAAKAALSGEQPLDPAPLDELVEDGIRRIREVIQGTQTVV